MSERKDVRRKDVRMVKCQNGKMSEQKKTKFNYMKSFFVYNNLKIHIFLYFTLTQLKALKKSVSAK